MAAAPALTLLLLVLLLPARQALATGYAGAEADTCGPALGGRRHGSGLEEYGGGRIVDITHAYRPGMPPDATAGPLVRLKESMENGSYYNLSELRMHCHMGTHVDAPGHMNQAHFAAGLDVDTLDLGVLNGDKFTWHRGGETLGFNMRVSHLLRSTRAFLDPTYLSGCP